MVDLGFVQTMISYLRVFLADKHSQFFLSGTLFQKRREFICDLELSDRLLCDWTTEDHFKKDRNFFRNIFITPTDFGNGLFQQHRKDLVVSNWPREDRLSIDTWKIVINDYIMHFSSVEQSALKQEYLY